MSDITETPGKEVEKYNGARINRALGIFMLFFSAVIIIAVLFTETFLGKMTNLIAGLILGLVGGILFFASRCPADSTGLSISAKERRGQDSIK